MILVLGGDPVGGGLANWCIRMAALEVIDDALDEANRKAENQSG